MKPGIMGVDVELLSAAMAAPPFDNSPPPPPPPPGIPIEAINLTEQIAELAREFVNSPLRDRMEKITEKLQDDTKEHKEISKAVYALGFQLSSAVKHANKGPISQVAIAVDDKVIIWIN